MILGFGEALIDVLPSGEVVGGAPLNFAIRAAELGRRFERPVGLITRVGRDARGDKILELLSTHHVPTDFVQLDSAHPTGYVDVEIDQGEASYRFGDDVAWDHIEASAEVMELASKASLVCYGSLAQRAELSRRTLDKFLHAADAAIKLYDINLRKPLPSKSIVEQSLKHADVLKCNESELQHLADEFSLDDNSDPEAIADQLMKEFDLRQVFWTRGQKGCVLQDRQQTTTGQDDLPLAQFGLPQENSDTVGAGDATAAALAIGLLEDWPAAQIVRAANLCGAFAANSRGATSPMPKELLDLICQPGQARG